jgi:hypothetical protein
MDTFKDEGICRFCLRAFSGRSIARHLVACKAKKQKDENDAAGGKQIAPIYHIKIQSYKPYWLNIEMKATATLADLDQFLRDIWLECCSHLSQFKIRDTFYLVPVAMDGWWDPEAKSMEDAQLQQVLSIRDKFEYEYDFGSTTYLEGQLYSIRDGVLKEKIRILARNTPPEFQCETCGAQATVICMECYEVYCRACLGEHECGEEMALPLVNSPRAGVCGYAGEDDFDDFGLE